MANPPWKEIRRVLDEALELPPSERQAFVDRACEDDDLHRQIVSMLRVYDDETHFLDRPLVDVRETFSDFQNGDRIGHYELIERLGEGGMGAVYLARRADDSFSKQVAIKLLRRTMGSEELIRRFRHERQILANLEHPHIAKLLDGGSTDEGIPYLVMDYVDGQPIDIYCEENNLGVRDRLELFAKVCRAVQFAHQNFVVHRDLKPSNILVDGEGEPRLLDFGIAKTLAPEAFPDTAVATRTGWTPMTPQYASPEQVQGRAITTASDVYSLGVLLFRLLTGNMPYNFDSRDLTAVVDAICHQDVPRPSSRLQPIAETGRSAGRNRRSTLRGDLDAIVLKALRKGETDRYGTAAQLLDDIERYFADRPVQARRDTSLYRFSRFLRRHRLALSAAASICLVVLASFIALLVQQERIRQERNRAILQRDRAETVSSWMVELFKLPDPGRSLGEQVTARELLDKSRDSIRQELAEQPGLQALLLGTLGQTYAQLGQLPEARELLEASIELHRDQPNTSEVQLATRLHQLAETMAFQGDFQEALKVSREARGRLEEVIETRNAGDDTEEGSTRAIIDHPELATVEALLAHIESRLGRYEQAEQIFAEALARPIADKRGRAKVLEMKANFEIERGQTARAQSLFEEALDLRRGVEDANHPEIALLESSLAAILQSEDPNEKERLFRSAVDRQRQIYEDNHPVLATAINNLAQHLYDQERFDEAKPLLLESLAMKRALYGESHPKIAATLNNLGNLTRRLGGHDEAEQAYRQALDIYARELGETHPEYASTLSNLGSLKLSQGAFDDAQDAFSRALDIVVVSFGAEHAKTAPIQNNLGELARRRGDVDGALQHFGNAVSAARQGGEQSSRVLTIALFNLAVLLSQNGEEKEAVEAYEEILTRLPDSQSLTLFTRTRLAALKLRQDALREAADLARHSLDDWEARGESRSAWALATQRTLGLALLRLGQLDEAGNLLRDRLTALESAAGTSQQTLELARDDLEELATVRRESATVR